MMTAPLLLAALGFFLSIYAYRIGQLAGKKKNFVAACDINDKVSCSRAFSSAYGSHFGLSNGVWGMIYYAGIIFLAIIGEPFYLFILASLGLVITAYLAYVLFARVKVTCIVCVATYLINLLLFFTSYRVIFG